MLDTRQKDFFQASFSSFGLVPLIILTVQIIVLPVEGAGETWPEIERNW
jgi:hypothetical protein